MDDLKNALQARQQPAEEAPAEPNFEAPGLVPEKQLMIALLRRLLGDSVVDDEKMIAGFPVDQPIPPEDLKGE